MKAKQLMFRMSTGRRIVFIWEHEIKDAWFQIEDYLKGGDAQ